MTAPAIPNINENMQIASRDLRSHPNASLTPEQLDAVLDRSRGGDKSFRPTWRPLRICLAILAAAIVYVASACFAAKAIGAEVTYADAYANADKVPMVVVHTAPWCGKCHPYVSRLVKDGVSVVEVSSDHPAFPLVPHTQVCCRVGSEWFGYHFVGAVATDTIKSAVADCEASIKQGVKK